MFKHKVDNREMRFGDKFMKYGDHVLPILKEFSIIVESDDIYNTSDEVLYGFPLSFSYAYNTYKGSINYIPTEKIKHGKDGKVEVKLRLIEMTIEDIDYV